MVVTGASSGLGRATSLLAAEAGVRLVLVGRDAATLARLAAECEALGAAALPVAVDVGALDAAERIVTAARDRFGGIDTWVNAAAVLIVGELGTETVAEIERLVATNVTGTALASRAALRQFRTQGHGVLINVSSLLGIAPNPLTPAYAMSKFAVRGLSLSLHHAVGRRGAIRVCTVMPGPIDTPMFEQAANHSGRQLRAIPPATSPERLAAGILRCARRPRRQLTVGASGWAILLAHRFAPRPTEWAVAQASARLLVRRRPAPPSSGALFATSVGETTHGGWRRGAWRRRSGDALGRLLARMP